MYFEYETPHLLMKVLKADNANAAAVLDFYLRDKALFESYEPDRVPNYYSVGFQKTVLKYEYNLALKEDHIRFYLFLKERPDQIIGTVCFHDITKNYYSTCELGYKISSAYHRMGYANEAINYALSALFEEVKIHRVCAWVDVSNAPSISLLRKLGFEEEGLCKDFIRMGGKWHDHIQFAMINPFQNEI